MSTPDERADRAASTDPAKTVDLDANAHDANAHDANAHDAGARDVDAGDVAARDALKLDGSARQGGVDPVPSPTANAADPEAAGDSGTEEDRDADEDRGPDGGAAIPADAERNARSAAVGMGLAGAGLLGAILAPALAGETFVWAWLAIAATGVMFALCALQLWCWRRVLAGDDTIWRRRTASWAAHVFSYLVALLGLFAVLVAMAAVGPQAPAFWAWVVAGLGMLCGQAGAAVQYLRPGGPPGTLPAHVRRLADAAGRLGD